MSREQNIWGREQRRDGSSEWPSTGFSTLNGELRASPSPRPRRRRRRSGYLRLALPFLLVLLAGSVGVLTLASHFRG
jgi:hypothetical protein